MRRGWEGRIAVCSQPSSLFMDLIFLILWQKQDAYLADPINTSCLGPIYIYYTVYYSWIYLMLSVLFLLLYFVCLFVFDAMQDLLNPEIYLLWIIAYLSQWSMSLYFLRKPVLLMYPLLLNILCKLWLLFWCWVLYTARGIQCWS